MVKISKTLVAGGLALGAALARRRHRSRAPHPEWARGAVIYELNPRQQTAEGTFKALLPRVVELKALGVDIVWFMPIHPIGHKARKGSLGSYYAVSDYYGVNPEFGTLEDFRALVDAFHQQGMRVIIDLVANHTSWDSVLAKTHPDWFKRDRKGEFVQAHPDWHDVIALDYRKRPLREYMFEMMEYWVRDVGIDGFRCDVADYVPTSFWEEARERLERIKNVFMLAEAESPELLRKAFDCDYASEYFRLFTKIAEGEAGVEEIDALVKRHPHDYPHGAWRMMFTTNHDQNSWLESDVNMYGPDGARAFAILAFALPGRPLIYSGQEVGNPKKLDFFERDPIDWDCPGARSMRAFYTRLCEIYHQYPSLQRGRMRRLATEAPVYAFWREAKGETPVLLMANLSPTPSMWKFRKNRTDLMSGAKIAQGPTELPPWSAFLIV